LEFSASFGFIHKESVTMYGHTIVKYYSQFPSCSDNFYQNLELLLYVLCVRLNWKQTWFRY